ncbi:MAG: TIM barrel protein, partial [Alkalispirochaeta sp.]
MSVTSGDRRPGPVSDLRRFAPHTVTTKPWQLEKAIDEYARAGFGGMSIWRDAMDGRNPATVRKQLTQAGLTGVSLVRGGFFAQTDPTARAAAMEDNRRCIGEAHELGLPLIVLVCGADPTIPLEESRAIITDSLAQLAPEAAAAGVQLGIEPLHPMYADTRSAVNTLSQAVRMAKAANAAAASPATPRATPPSPPSAPPPPPPPPGEPPPPAPPR